MKKLLTVFLCCVFLLSLLSCEKFDENYGKSESKKGENTNKVTTEQIKIPEIKSDDDIMPTYVDISLYDEENYADIYLGSKFSYKITYAGSYFDLPTTYKDVVKEGWNPVDSDNYNESSQILAGKSLELDFVNEYNTIITAVFHNAKQSSVSLKKCPLVKLVIKENEFLNPDSSYGQFWVNGISNASAITDVIELLGSPSHFYKVAENKYYLDWFITENDRRSGITVYVDTAEDHIDSIEISYY